MSRNRPRRRVPSWSAPPPAAAAQQVADPVRDQVNVHAGIGEVNPGGARNRRLRHRRHVRGRMRQDEDRTGVLRHCATGGCQERRCVRFPASVCALSSARMGSEGPASGAAGLFGHHGVRVLGGELVDVPERRAGTRGTVVVGEASVGHRRRPPASAKNCAMRCSCASSVTQVARPSSATS